MMKIAVLTNEKLKEELIITGVTPDAEIIWIKEAADFLSSNAGVFIDLLFEPVHVEALKKLKGLVVINSVVDTLAETDPLFMRINGWPTFLKSSLIEACSLQESNKQKAENAFSYFNKKLEWVKDEPGFISARVICMIINEAFISFKEDVSSKEDIDIAMKLGTNYPYGPFEWSERIGLTKIIRLMQKLNEKQERYSSFISV